VRKILRSPLVKGVARWASREPFIWDGIYESFAQVPVMGDGFASDVWLSETQRYTQAAAMALRNNRGEIAESVAQYHALFSLLVASCGSPERPVRVVDCGGGMGIGFASLMRSVPEVGQLDYLVVDNKQSCERGRQLFADFPEVRFSSELRREPERVDVLVLSSVLQFVEDYEALLKKLATLAPSFWFFTFVPAGDIPRFASAQLNVPGSVLPVWFFNVRELVAKIEALGYRLVFKSALERVFDMSNFPATHQLTRHCNLLFCLR
jgi:putative methyltransferase (TIGR04325 family)